LEDNKLSPSGEIVQGEASPQEVGQKMTGSGGGVRCAVACFKAESAVH